jgi:hypothetical protein
LRSEARRVTLPICTLLTCDLTDDCSHVALPLLLLLLNVPDRRKAAWLESNSAVAWVRLMSLGMAEGVAEDDGVTDAEGELVGVAEGVGVVEGVADVVGEDEGEGDVEAKLAPQPLITIVGTRFEPAAEVAAAAKLSEWKLSSLQSDQVHPSRMTPPVVVNTSQEKPGARFRGPLAMKNP